MQPRWNPSRDGEFTLLVDREKLPQAKDGVRGVRPV